MCPTLTLENSYLTFGIYFSIIHKVGECRHFPCGTLVLIRNVWRKEIRSFKKVSYSVSRSMVPIILFLKLWPLSCYLIILQTRNSITGASVQTYSYSGFLGEVLVFVQYRPAGRSDNSLYESGGIICYRSSV